MIYNNVVINVLDPDDTDTVIRLLKECADLSREEPGCARFEVYQSQSDPQQFFLIERWGNQQQLDAHREAHAFKNIYVPKVLPLVNRTPHPSDLIG